MKVLKVDFADSEFEGIIVTVTVDSNVTVSAFAGFVASTLQEKIRKECSVRNVTHMLASRPRSGEIQLMIYEGRNSLCFLAGLTDEQRTVFAVHSYHATDEQMRTLATALEERK